MRKVGSLINKYEGLLVFADGIACVMKRTGKKGRVYHFDDTNISNVTNDTNIINDTNITNVSNAN